MPLTKSPSRAAMSANIGEMINSGHPRAQAIAAAYSNARKYGAKFAEGGNVTPFDPQYQWLRREFIRNLNGTQPTTTPPRPAGDAAVIPLVRPKANGGLVGYAAGGVPDSSWFERSQARDVMRSGMLHSAVPGRTDKLPISVASGSYVVPADIVSALGQGNSQAGGQVLGNMFSSGPFGMRPMSGRRGAGGPKALRTPKMPKTGKFADGGASAGVPIVAAGGEYVIHADDVAKVGGGDVARGHKILDAFVKHVRTKHIKTLRNLPGPKKN